jgi:MYXO-CTERM domain-containing protein
MTMLLFSVFFGLAQAASITVAPGDDINTLAASLSPGSELVFSDGVYPIHSTIYIKAVGTEEQPVRLVAAEGATPILEFQVTSGGNYIVRIEEAAYVELDGLTIRGGAGWEANTYTGISVGGDSQHITVKNCLVSETGGTSIALGGGTGFVTLEHNELRETINGHGIYAGRSDGTEWVEQSVFHNNWIHDIRGDYSYGIWVSPASTGNTITHNNIYNVSYSGLMVHSTELGAANVVEGNAIWNVSGYGMEVYGTSLIRNNLIFNIDGVGLRTRASDFGNYEQVVFSMNTITQTGGWAVEADDWEGQIGMVFANNAVCNPTGQALSWEVPTDTALTQDTVGLFTGNVVCGQVENPTWFYAGYSAGDGYNDFTDAVGWNFYPSPTSLLVDTGTADGAAYIPETDFNGVPREGDSPDVGAYEWDGDSNPGWSIQEGFKSLELKDTRTKEFVGGCCQNSKGEDTAKAALLLPLLGLGALRRRRSPARRT